MGEGIVPLNPEINNKIDAIDLTNVKNRLMDPTKEYKWSAKKTAEVEKKYKNFLKLIAGGGTHVPTVQIDAMWHEHILRTRQYALDCKNCFGRFVHHNPDISPEELGKAWEQTQQSYKQEFGESYSKK
jgi:hypothetical protein